MVAKDRLMVQFVVSSRNRRKFASDVKRILADEMALVMKEGAPILLEQIAINLKDSIAASLEFRSLKTRLQGEFGFTDAEVQDLNRILFLLVPGFDSDITNIEIKLAANRSSAILQWVDFEKLRNHPFAQHDLTKFEEGQFKLTRTVSWVEWLEEGVSVAGYRFFIPTGKGRKFSRSGQGLMKKTRSGFWTFEPTKLFESTANKFNEEFARRGFGIVLQRLIGR
jgi:hypothetical protein